MVPLAEDCRAVICGHVILRLSNQRLHLMCDADSEKKVNFGPNSGLENETELRLRTAEPRSGPDLSRLKGTGSTMRAVLTGAAPDLLKNARRALTLHMPQPQTETGPMP